MPTVLAIDDAEQFLELLEVLLKRGGFDMLKATTGIEGIEIARTEQPDVIVLDYMMPEMNGFQTYEGLSSDATTAHIPVIMITAYSADFADQRTKALRMGMEDYLTKPISPSGLVERLNDALR